MTWEAYGSFVAFALLLIVVPGPDFVVTTRNTLVGGRGRGAWTAAGVATSNAVQGAAAAGGLGAVIARSEPLFAAIRWSGAAYLAYLGVQALRSAIAGRCPTPADDIGTGDSAAERRAGWQQGFLCNITNPKVLLFYLAVLPQFLEPGAGVAALLLLAFSHAALSLVYLLALVSVTDRARRVLLRRTVRRGLDGVTGFALLGFGVRMALERD